jgi:hypothetical protein
MRVLCWSWFGREVFPMPGPWCISAMMGRWSRWLPRKPTSRAGVWRARVTALVLFVAATTMAVLLAVLFHLAWQPVLIGILATVPLLYVAWLAVPGVIRQPEPTAANKLAYGDIREATPQPHPAGPAELRGWAVPLYPHILTGHTGRVRSVAFSPDGRLLVR